MDNEVDSACGSRSFSLDAGTTSRIVSTPGTIEPAEEADPSIASSVVSSTEATAEAFARICSRPFQCNDRGSNLAQKAAFSSSFSASQRRSKRRRRTSQLVAWLPSMPRGLLSSSRFETYSLQRLSRLSYRSSQLVASDGPHYQTTHKTSQQLHVRAKYCST